MSKSKKKIKAIEFDKLFDEGGDVTPYLDTKSAKFEHAIQRINLDMPKEVLERVDREAYRIGIPRTSLLKIWISQQVDRLAG
jgi:predicted DNA binding CopG/RHH family protein